MRQSNGARVYDLRALHISARRTVAARLVVVEIDHAVDERQTALDFGSIEASRGRSATSRSGVHVIDCEALALGEGCDDCDAIEIGGAA